jgi:hypothetical protein
MFPPHTSRPSGCDLAAAREPRSGNSSRTDRALVFRRMSTPGVTLSPESNGSAIHPEIEMSLSASPSTQVRLPGFATALVPSSCVCSRGPRPTRRETHDAEGPPCEIEIEGLAPSPELWLPRCHAVFPAKPVSVPQPAVPQHVLDVLPAVDLVKPRRCSLERAVQIQHLRNSPPFPWVKRRPWPPCRPVCPGVKPGVPGLRAPTGQTSCRGDWSSPARAQAPTPSS